jgi:hypothetical protein
VGHQLGMLVEADQFAAQRLAHVVF